VSNGTTGNSKLKVWADQKVGQPVVGDGECYALADQALRKQGFKSAPDFGKVTPKADYIWGQQVDIKRVTPGDILQFRDHNVKIVTETKLRETDTRGGWTEKTTVETLTLKRGHHTAIVSENFSNGELIIVEQHVKDPKTGRLSRTVRKNTLQTQDSTRTSTTTTTRRDPKKGLLTVQTTTTVTITVTGTVWPYRPQQ
jgi:hypothetical protein